ncbi:MAG: hypothetical protein CYG59_02805, partial [Chloroflexi bacterium]
FDRPRFPTLALRPDGDFARKEFIPAEAVYAYIEAKNTLFLSGCAGEGQGVVHASAQVGRVKNVLSSREAVELTDVLPGVELGPGLTAGLAGAGWPQRRGGPRRIG